MEKITWSRPTGNVVAFAADEYIAACSKSGKVYLFECSAGRTNWAYNVYLNGADGVAETSDDIQWSVSANQAYRDPDSYIDWRPNSTAVGYHPCGQTHTAESTEEFWNGYMYAWNREDNSFSATPGPSVIPANASTSLCGAVPTRTTPTAPQTSISTLGKPQNPDPPTPDNLRLF